MNAYLKTVVVALVLVIIGKDVFGAEKKKGDVLLSHILRGTQESDRVVLEDTKDFYFVEGEYVVPIGKSLKVEQGVRIFFAKGAGLLVQGDLSVDGVTNAPVMFQGKSFGIGYWEGVKIEKSDGSDITGAVISGAKTGVSFSESKAAIRKSLLFRNDIAVNCQGGEPTIEDCACIENRDNAIHIHGATPHVDHCVLKRNGGYGVWGRYGAGVTLAQTIVTENKKGGLYCFLYDCKVSANNCAFINNKKFEVETGTGLPWDFTENFWGENMTKVLEQKGCNIRLPKIKDKRHGDVNLGIVDVAKFLKEMPENCGPRECPHVKGIY